MVVFHVSTFILLLHQTGGLFLFKTTVAKPDKVWYAVEVKTD